jgi:hypothetical protein
MAVKKRKRLKWYAGGGVLLALLFLLGDSTGLFRVESHGPDSAIAGSPGTGGARSEPDQPDQPGENDATEADREPAPKPDAELASQLPVRSGRSGRTGGAAGGGAGGGEVGLASDENPVPPTSATGDAGGAPARRGAGARVDELMGIIARYERAISADDLAGLAVLVDRVRARPIPAPASLAERWQAVRARADAALACADRLRDMVEQGEILKAERLIAPIFTGSTPQWVRNRLDADTKKFGWPALSRAWRVVDSGVEPAAGLAKMRRVRFVKDGDLHEGTLWRVDGRRATVRVAGSGGFTFPVVLRRDVEPVDPGIDEALAQGVAAARESQARRVALWSCHFHERGEIARESQLRALIH